MLKAEIYINDRIIDIIQIHNTGEMYDKKQMKYEIIDPLAIPLQHGKKLVDTIVKHKREDGYRKLLIKALKILDKKKIKTTDKRMKPEKEDN